MNKDCIQCLYFDNCDSDETCKGYESLTDEIDIDEIIESGRTAFRKEWFRYIEENDE